MFTKNHKLLAVHFVLVLILILGMLELEPIQPVFASTLMVTNTNDSGAGSLRQAIADAASGDTITFDPLLSGQMLTLETSLIIDKDLTIDASMLSPQITVSGLTSYDNAGNNRIFIINMNRKVILKNLTITKSAVSGYIYIGGIEIQNDATLTTTGCTISNFTGDSGITNWYGTLTMMNSSVLDNSSHSGGGVFNKGTAVLTNVVIANNSVDSSGGGGGIHNSLGGNLTITSSTISNNSSELPYGGGIHNEGNLTLTDSTVTGNSGIGIYNDLAYFGVSMTIANSTISNNLGRGAGGIENLGPATVTHSTFEGNSSESGGGIYNTSTLTITNSIFSNNQASSDGGGIENSGTLSVQNSTFSGNTAGNGGGIYNDTHGLATINNTAIYDNHAKYGGGLYNHGNITVNNTTISNNVASVGAPPYYQDGRGGGIYTGYGGSNLALNSTTVTNNSSNSMGGGIYYYGFESIKIHNSILANNIARNNSSSDCDGRITSLGHNLIGDNQNCYFVAATGDLVGTSSHPINPRLGPLQDNGGPTFTHALMVGSPAIDAGEDANCLSTDQRGVTRPQNGRCDIGAYESRTLTVTKTDDTNDGVCSADCSLRDAMNSASYGDRIVFQTNLAGQTITLADRLIIDRELAIDGSGLVSQITISGGNSHHIEIPGNVPVTISDLIITNGYSGLGGGAIYKSGPAELVIRNSTLTHNQANAGGGAIYNTGSGDLTIVGTTIVENQASQGGAIDSIADGALNIVNSTITANQATLGGAIRIGGSELRAYNSTFALNVGSREGSELYTMGSVKINLYNTVLACIPGNDNCIVSTDLPSTEYINSIIDYGTLADFGLAELADNGGPTQTMALLSGSRLIDVGDDSICRNTLVNNVDQRGVTRPLFAGCDIGAFELEVDNTPPRVISIASNGPDPTDATFIGFNVAFSEPVLGVDISDFALHTTGNVSDVAIMNVDGGIGSRIYRINVYTGAGNGTLSLSLKDSGTEIVDLQGIAINSGFSSGDIITINKLTLNNWIVTKNTDTNDGICNTDCSLREAILQASSGDIIHFDLSLSGKTITLASSLPAIEKKLTVEGGEQTIIIDGAGSYRIFEVTETGDLTVNKLTIQNGNHSSPCISESSTTPSCGGGIYVDGMLTVANSTFSGNSAGNGGAISIGRGITHVYNSTFLGNSATNVGGAIDNWVGVLNVTNSTFIGNSAPAGGGIYNDISWLMLTNNTFSHNSAVHGGALYNAGTLNFSNNILANSLSSDDCYNEDGAGEISINTNNLVETNAPLPNNCGMPALTNDPELGSLADNGGPTKTLRLLSGSPAIDAGDDANCPSNDQRGLARPQGSHCDIGAYEYQEKGGNTTGVFRPSNGLLYLKNQNITGFADVAINYGLGGDYPVVGDWDGNGTATIGVYRAGKFYLRNSNTVGFADLVFAFGQIGDQPVAGDWDGDGIDTIGVYRPSNGLFLLRNSNSAGAEDMSFYLGNVRDVGIAGDWDGDGKDTTGVFRPSNGIIFLKNTNETGYADVALNYGIPGDKPVTGDWDNDGIDTIGVYRNGQFLLRNSNTVGFADIVFGLGNPGDMPIAGNWDGVP